MAHGKNPPMNAVEMPGAHSPLPTAFADTCARQLLDRNHAVLSGGEPSDQLIWAAVTTICTHAGALSDTPPNLAP
jgi:hypothetical protein